MCESMVWVNTIVRQLLHGLVLCARLVGAQLDRLILGVRVAVAIGRTGSCCAGDGAGGGAGTVEHHDEIVEVTVLTVQGVSGQTCV